MKDKDKIEYLRKECNVLKNHNKIIGGKLVKLYSEKNKKKRRDIVWHIYHTILAIELGAVAIIEFIELMYK
tara:strand:- start:310 stop:522 length:213 start_codon:yes stop_codon:yes gene_type:complete